MRHPVDSRLLKEKCFIFICCLTNYSFELALQHILDAHFSNSVEKPVCKKAYKATIVIQCCMKNRKCMCLFCSAYY